MSLAKFQDTKSTYPSNKQSEKEMKKITVTISGKKNKVSRNKLIKKMKDLHT